MPRPARPSPREMNPGWPDVRNENDATAEVGRQLAVNLREAIGSRSFRAVQELTGVHYSTVQAILDGRVWPDVYTLTKLEQGLGVDLWPGLPERENESI